MSIKNNPTIQLVFKRRYFLNQASSEGILGRIEEENQIQHTIELVKELGLTYFWRFTSFNGQYLYLIMFNEQYLNKQEISQHFDLIGIKLTRNGEEVIIIRDCQEMQENKPLSPFQDLRGFPRLSGMPEIKPQDPVDWSIIKEMFGEEVFTIPYHKVGEV